MSDKPSKLKIADREFTSRLLVGTGKFGSNELMRDALMASGTEIVTVALRRADLSGKGDPFANILDFIDPKRFLLLPNTSGARNAAEAVRLARLAAAAGLPKWVKLEIHPDARYLLPDPVETLAAAEILVKGRIHGSAVHQRRSGAGETITGCRHRDGDAARFTDRQQSRDRNPRPDRNHHRTGDRAGGGGRRSRRAEPGRGSDGNGRRRGAVNTAIAIAADPVRMAQAFRKAIEAGREAREIGLAEKLATAAATSPLTGFFSKSEP